MSSPGALDGGEQPISAEVDKFLSSNEVDENAANDLRQCPTEVQRIVLSRGGLSTARNPSAALIARIRDARTSVTSTGGDKGSGQTNPDVEAFLKQNEVDESAAASLRSAPPDVQRVVIGRGELTGARNPSSALLSRIRDAKQNGGRDNHSTSGGAPGFGGGVPPPPGYPPNYGMGGMPPGMPPGGMPPGGYPGYPGGYPGMYPGYNPYMGGAYGMGAAAYGSSAYMQQYAAAAAAAGQPMGAYGAYGAGASTAQPQLQDRARSRSRSASSSYSSRSRRRHKKSHRKRRG